MILSGNSQPTLAQSLAKLTNQLLAEVSISKFPNGEKRVQVKSQLKNKVVVVVQSFSEPVDEHIIEFCLLVDAAENLGAKKVIGVVPWLGYSPQDKLFTAGEPISVQVIAGILKTLGLDHIILVDVHSEDALKYFTFPVSEISALPIYIDYFRHRNLDHHVAVALDKGATKRAKAFALALNLPLVQFDKSRNLVTGEVSFRHLTGDVSGKHVVSFDDFVSTGATRIKACNILKEKGALTYTDCITHALLTGESPRLLQQSSIDAILATDSYPIPGDKRFPKLKIFPIAPIIAQTLKNLL